MVGAVVEPSEFEPANVVKVARFCWLKFGTVDLSQRMWSRSPVFAGSNVGCELPLAWS